MSRYDIEKFDPPPDPDLVCCICQCVLDRAVECPCRHVFCQVCIERWLTNRHTCPTCRTRTKKQDLKPVLPLVQNMLNRMLMICDNRMNGCVEKIMLEHFDRHVSNCGFEMRTCRFTKCGRQLQRREIEAHETSSCDHREMLCTGECGLMVALKKNHMIEILKAKLQELNNLSQSLKDQLEQLRQQLNERPPNLPSLFDSSSDSSDDDVVDMSDIFSDSISEHSFPDTLSNHSAGNVSDDNERSGNDSAPQGHITGASNTAGNDDGADVVEQVERTVVNSLFELSSRLERVRNQMRAVLNSGLVQEQSHLNDEVRLPSVTLDSIVNQNRSASNLNNHRNSTNATATATATMQSSSSDDSDDNFEYQNHNAETEPIPSVSISSYHPSDSESDSHQQNTPSHAGESSDQGHDVSLGEDDASSLTGSNSGSPSHRDYNDQPLNQSMSSHVILTSPPGSPTLSWTSDNSSSIPTISSPISNPHSPDNLSSAVSSPVSSIASMQSRARSLSPITSDRHSSVSSYQLPDSPVNSVGADFSCDESNGIPSDNNNTFDYGSSDNDGSEAKSVNYNSEDHSSVHFTIGTTDSAAENDVQDRIHTPSVSGHDEHVDEHSDVASSLDEKNTVRAGETDVSETELNYSYDDTDDDHEDNVSSTPGDREDQTGDHIDLNSSFNSYEGWSNSEPSSLGHKTYTNIVDKDNHSGRYTFDKNTRKERSSASTLHNELHPSYDNQYTRCNAVSAMPSTQCTSPLKSHTSTSSTALGTGSGNPRNTGMSNSMDQAHVNQCEPDSTQGPTQSETRRSSDSPDRSAHNYYLSDSSDSDQSMKYITKRLRPEEHESKTRKERAENEKVDKTKASDSSSRQSQSKQYSFRKRTHDDFSAGSQSKKQKLEETFTKSKHSPSHGGTRYSPSHGGTRYSPSHGGTRYKSNKDSLNVSSKSQTRSGHKRSSTVQSDGIQQEANGQSLNVKIDLSLINYSGHLVTEPSSAVPSATVVRSSANISPGRSTTPYKSLFRQSDANTNNSSHRQRSSPNRLENRKVLRNSSNRSHVSSPSRPTASLSIANKSNTIINPNNMTHSEEKQDNSDSSSDATWAPGSLATESDASITEGGECETDSSYEVQVPKSTAALLEEYASDSSDGSWTFGMA
ncbi:PZRN3-like protein [Mya arenaria]|uniref:PZRN3-like protein n=1 Tax=Mya arenaria TaxID=6604 RepID=A0ABY7DFB5_MYAAR|nr:PZRN3-like protein [Mya arenaria]